MRIRQICTRTQALLLLAALGLSACTSVGGGYGYGSTYMMYQGNAFYDPYYYGRGYYRPPSISPRPPPVRPMNPIAGPSRPMPMPMPMPRPAMPSRR